MSGKFLLDTNIVIALFADDSNVKDKLSQAAEVFIPSIAIGELYYGARKSGRTEANLARIDQLVAGSVVLACDVSAAQHYGDIKHNLKIKGHPLPENDIWIAAIALAHNLILVTRDAHFQEVEHLYTVNW